MKFHIDSIDPKPDKKSKKIVVKDQRFISISGWAVDDQAKDAGAGVWVDIDGISYPAVRIQRHGIADQFDKPAYEYSGFIAGIRVSSLPPGSHELSFKILSKDKTCYYQTESMVLEIPNS